MDTNNLRPPNIFPPKKEKISVVQVISTHHNNISSPFSCSNLILYNNSIGIHIYKGPIKTYIKFNFEVLFKIKMIAPRKGRKSKRIFKFCFCYSRKRSD